MDYMFYTKWHPIPALRLVDKGCGELSYTLIYRSWSEAMKGDEIMSRPVGASYFSPNGTNHIITATIKESVGDHVAIILVASNYAKNSTT